MEATVAVRAPAGATTAAPRLGFVDNIRWTVIALVVLVHACVTYSGVGSWFYLEPTNPGVVGGLLMVVVETFSQAFFMGILFFIAAAFIPASYDRKGFGRFVLERLLRLGVPALIFMLLLDPLCNLIKIAGGGSRLTQGRYLAHYLAGLQSGRFFEWSGPLWFAVALLGFSILYALGRLVVDVALRTPTAGRQPRPVAPLSPRAVNIAAVVLIVGLTLASFFMRMVQPIGTSVMNMQLGYFPQYVILFVLGLRAGRSGLLRSLPRRAGRLWLAVAFPVGLAAWLLVMGFGGALSGNLEPYMGGWHWQALGYAAWEAFVCVAISIGLLVLYRERVSSPTPVTALLSRTSFGVYVFHAPILVGVSMLLRTVEMYAPLKALAAAAVAWLLSLAVAWLVRAVPGLGKLFA